MKPTLKSLLASLVLAAMSATSADAAVIVTLPTVSTAGSIVFTQDIHFTSTGGSVGAVVFDEWVTSDGSTNFHSSFSPSLLSYSLNGGATATVVLNFFKDNNNALTGEITPNDGSLNFVSSVATSPGNVFTLKAATYTLAASSLPAGFNPQAGQTFTGNAFLVENSKSGARRSANTSVGAVPEPSRALLVLCGLSTLAFRRRK